MTSRDFWIRPLFALHPKIILFVVPFTQLRSSLIHFINHSQSPPAFLPFFLLSISSFQTNDKDNGMRPRALSVKRILSLDNLPTTNPTFDNQSIIIITSPTHSNTSFHFPNTPSPTPSPASSSPFFSISRTKDRQISSPTPGSRFLIGMFEKGRSWMAGNGGGGGSGKTVLPSWMYGGGGDVSPIGSGNGNGNGGGSSPNGRRGSRFHYPSARSLQLPLLLLFSFSLGSLLSPSHFPSISFFPTPDSTHPPFYVPPTSFRFPPDYPSPSPWPDLHQEGLEQPPQSNKWNSNSATRKVPNVVHYIYGLKEPGDEKMREKGLGEEFPYYAYLAVRSVVVNLGAERIYFHYKYLPTGPWFDALTPYLTLRPIVHVPTEILGNRLNHYAHKSDVLRLDALLNTGGIYLDIDIYVLRSFEPLLYAETTLAMEASPNSQREALDPEGLCNGVIVTAPHSSFLERWRATYESFRDGEWAEHSVAGPWALARRYPSEVQVLNNRAMFWPGWWGDEVSRIHEKDEYDFYGSGQFAYHAWESLAMQYLGNLSPKKIRNEDTSFNRMARRFMGDDDDSIWRKSKGSD